MSFFGAMKRPAFLGALLLAAAMGLSASPAMARTVIGIGVGVGVPGWGPYYGPYYGPGPYYYPPPAYYPPPGYYAPPPVVVAPAPVAAPAAQLSTPTCNQGQWRQQDGSVVNGVACQQADGTWKLNQ
jgi:hypothetical protein